MNIYISIVSHNNWNMIKNNHDLMRINQLDNVKVCIKDNTGETELMTYCRDNQIDYLSESKGLGFGANNNYIFNYVLASYSPKKDDVFLLLNPDVYLSFEQFLLLNSELGTCSQHAFTVDLFKDNDFTIRDPFIRKFPRAFDFFSSFVLKKNNTIIDREKPINKPIDWCAGSFMGFNIETYLELKGFDEGYFMYCEDIDLCYRANELGINLKYYENIKAVHLAQHSNRKLMSKSFRWHLKSIFRYLFISRLPRISALLGVKKISSINQDNIR